jgi:hypothetical protein
VSWTIVAIVVVAWLLELAIGWTVGYCIYVLLTADPPVRARLLPFRTPRGSRMAVKAEREEGRTAVLLPHKMLREQKVR